jgi:NAD(P)-dependent dehydrogenase (short-subunit alcohol dehydrogenase family)
VPDRLRLSGKAAIVTGAGAGIGKAAALLFAREGASVVAGVYEDSNAAQLEQEAAGLPGALAIVPCDVTRDEDAARLAAAARSRFGGLDILVNNAGIAIPGTVTDTSDEDWNRVIDVNLKGVFRCSRHAVPLMVERGGGSIVNVSSINGIRGNTRLFAYSASKGGVVGVTMAMAIDHAPQNIRVNCVCPAAIDTEMTRRSIASAADPSKQRQALIAKHPLGRIGRAEEVAYAILFLASDEASFISGVALPVDGGRSIR